MTNLDKMVLGSLSFMMFAFALVLLKEAFFESSGPKEESFSEIKRRVSENTLRLALEQKVIFIMPDSIGTPDWGKTFRLTYVDSTVARLEEIGVENPFGKSVYVETFFDHFACIGHGQKNVVE